MRAQSRIFEGKREYSGIKYYVGQVKIVKGYKKGCFKSVTEEYEDKQDAEVALYYYQVRTNGKAK